MKRVLYLRFLELTSSMLNICVRWHWWWAVKSLIKFRKKNIVAAIRKTRVVA
jgi:hypothetical protein